MRILKFTTIVIALLASTTLASAVESKEGAMAMVKKAVTLIKADGPEKAYATISAPGNQFVDGGIYAVVQGFDGVTLAHATNPKLIGKNMIEQQDVDRKFFARDLAENGKKQASFWYDFKFVNPVTKKIQVKDMYCESVEKSVVCAGLYRP